MKKTEILHMPGAIYPSEFSGAPLTVVVEGHLGMRGMMISGSKSGYQDSYPTNVPVFNSNVVTAEDGKIWYGDIDLTLSASKLIALAVELKKKVYVLREMDGRFENDKTPKVDRAVFVADPDGTGKIAGDLENYCHICTAGKNKDKWVYKPEFRR